ncbi:MAG: phage tail tube protein [Casimicrobium sp.]
MTLPNATFSGGTAPLPASVNRFYATKRLASHGNTYQFTAADRVPTPTEISLTPSATKSEVPLYNDTPVTVSTKTSVTRTAQVSTISKSNDPVVAQLRAAGDAFGADAEIWYAFRTAEGSWYTGSAIVDASVPAGSVSDVFSWQFPISIQSAEFFAIGVHD